MRVLGIDPGSLKAGYAAIDVEGRQTKLVECGTLRFESKTQFIDRLAQIHFETKKLISSINPDVIVLESLIYAKSIPALAKLAQARGTIIAAFGDRYVGKIFEYAPTLVKSTVTGHGQATKEGVDKSLKMIFGKQLDFATDDASDALAIALCHVLHNGTPKMKSSSRARTLKNVFAKWEGN